MIRGLVSGMISGLISPLINIVRRWAYNFDCVDDRGQLAFRAINPDGDNTFEFWTPSDFTLNVAIISQNISTAGNLREFQFGVDAGGLMYIGFGGTYTTVFTSAQGLKPSTKYGVTLIGTQFSIYEGGLLGQLVRAVPFTKGTAREPAAVTLIGCRGNGAGSYGQFFNGRQYDVRINGVLYPLDAYNQAIQLPSPSGLGPEIVTEARHANPPIKGNHWTYLGGGRWQYVGDGSSSELRLHLLAEMPAAGYLEFEVESYSGTGQMRCCSAVVGSGDRLFNSVGVKRWLHTGGTDQWAFNRNSGVVSCVIKNISFKPLWVASAAELVTNGNFSNGTTGWGQPSGSIAVSNGQCTLTTTANQNSRFEQNLTLEPNAYYVCECDAIARTSNTLTRLQMIRGAAGNWAQIGAAEVAGGTTSGKLQFIFLAPASDALVQLRGDGVNAGTITVDNISVRKLDSLCNPLTLTNTASTGWQEIQP